jgi:glycosyltransferase involved in cell wall biosynthesis
MWESRSVSLIYPTYRERWSLCDAILEAAATGYIDEIIIVNNNAELGTSTEVAKAAQILTDMNRNVTVREIFEPIQGYGAACLRGMDEASAEIRCLSEPDGTFVAGDVLKLLTYTDKCDLVFGSRTVKTFIWSGANMWWFLRWGNWATAKLLEVLFNTNYLSDVGCTMRLIKADAYEKMRPYLDITDNFFGPQMIVVGRLLSIPSVQVPVNYRARIGKSSVTGSFTKALMLGIQMISLIIRYRLLGLRASGSLVSRLTKG